MIDATGPAGASVVSPQPMSHGGRFPHAIVCTPATGSTFAIGETPVTCTATDAEARQASCGFTVTVRVPSTLARTRYLAFGDSITEGVVSAALLSVDNPDSYPFKLHALLNQAYPTQQLVVVNEGQGGERLKAGLARLPGVLDAHSPEVFLLLEGIIDIARIPTATNAAYLEAMITEARNRGVEVILATILPVGASLEAKEPRINAAVEALNAEIHHLAFEFGLGAPVDLFAVFSADPTLIGQDGLHPTPEGMNRIADAFLDAIVSREPRTGGSTSSWRPKASRQPSSRRRTC